MWTVNYYGKIRAQVISQMNTDVTTSTSGEGEESSRLRPLRCSEARLCAEMRSGTDEEESRGGGTKIEDDLCACPFAVTLPVAALVLTKACD